VLREIAGVLEVSRALVVAEESRALTVVGESRTRTPVFSNSLLSGVIFEVYSLLWYSGLNFGIKL